MIDEQSGAMFGFSKRKNNLLSICLLFQAFGGLTAMDSALNRFL